MVGGAGFGTGAQGLKVEEHCSNDYMYHRSNGCMFLYGKEIPASLADKWGGRITPLLGALSVFGIIVLFLLLIVLQWMVQSTLASTHLRKKKSGVGLIQNELDACNAGGRTSLRGGGHTNSLENCSAGYRFCRVPVLPGTGFAEYRFCRVPGTDFAGYRFCSVLVLPGTRFFRGTRRKEVEVSGPWILICKRGRPKCLRALL